MVASSLHLVQHLEKERDLKMGAMMTMMRRRREGRGLN
jgi:hypothetical protein